MKIGVLGAGAIGCYVGGKLLGAGHDVVFVGRLREEVAQHGLNLTSFTGASTFLEGSRVAYSDDATSLRGVDVVLVCVKSGATETAARPLTAVLDRPTPVVSLQNGVSNPERLRAALPGHPVLPGMVPFNVAHRGPGLFHNGTSGPLALERSGGLERPLAAALAQAGFEVELHDDLRRVQWTKLVLNLNNSLNALAGIPLRAELEDRGYRRVLSRCVQEGLAVLRAAGIRPVRIGKILPAIVPFVLRLPDALFVRVAAAMLDVDEQARSSMLDDLDRRRDTEVDFLNGEILALGDRHGVDVRTNREVLALVKAAEARRAGSPRIPADRLARLVSVSN